MIDLLSKLLANENITIQRGNYRTASFDIKNRVLQLPTLVGMSESEELLFALHEVGHALFTDIEYVNYIKKRSERRFADYMNVIEDVRIERKIKTLYPGSRKDFFSGYKLLNERDFFGISGKNVNEYCLIDRINLFFKVGYNCGVKFSPKEMEFVKEAEITNTIADVEDLAFRIYQFSAEQRNNQQKTLDERLKNNEFEIDDSLDEGDADEGDDMFEDFEEGEEGDSDASSGQNGDSSKEDSKQTGESSSPEGDDEQMGAPGSETQSNFNRFVENSIENEKNPVTYVKSEISGNYDFVPFKEFRKLQTELDSFRIPNNSRDSIRRSASYLHREFEMKKAAYRYSRTTVAKSGALNPSALYQYKTSEDLFKKYNVTPNDKNHGMIVLVDFSGSMMDVINSAIQEVYTLAYFCNMAKIPFRMFFFNSTIRKKRQYVSTFKKVKGLSFSGDSFSLVEIANSKFSWKENEACFEDLLSRNFGGYGLNNTPLTQSLILLMNDVIPQFQKEFSLQKVSFVTITDGESNRCWINAEDGFRSGDKHQRIFIEDMGKKYPTSLDDVQHTIMNIIKMRYPYVSTIGYYIQDSLSKRNLSDFIKVFDSDRSLRYEEYWKDVNHKVDVLLAKSKTKFIKTSAPGYDSMMIFVGNSIKQDFNLNDIKKGATVASIAKSFGKGMRAGISNKIVLSNLIDTIS